jgi:hypothetical protein
MITTEKEEADVDLWIWPTTVDSHGGLRHKQPAH